MHYFITEPSRLLSEALTLSGVPLDLRCGGRGSCGRCQVLLLSGTWQIDHQQHTVSPGAPLPALACRTRLVSASGQVDVPATSLRETTGQVSASWHSWSSQPLPALPFPVIGIDLGTTTVAGVKILHGHPIATASTFNQQNSFGDNVLTRIQLAGTPSGLHTLRQAAIDSINQVLAQLDPSGVATIAIAGNTVMSCLLHGIDPTPIGVLPFTPPCHNFPATTAADLQLNAAPTCQVLTLPAISGYLGGDLTAGLSETSLSSGQMLVDIGTNCEIIFHLGDQLLCTAAAAGPAFEGAGLSCSCRAGIGAIDHLHDDNSLSIIGGPSHTPRGLCGSALIDFLALHKKSGHLNRFGRLQSDAPNPWPIAPGISIAEKDIEQLLKAKAAVRAGIDTLIQHCQRVPEQILLAGGFAQYLNLEHALAIGMLPPGNYALVGNTSLGGAARLATAPRTLPHLEHLARQPRELSLNSLPNFEDNYIDSLLLDTFI